MSTQEQLPCGCVYAFNMKTGIRGRNISKCIQHHRKGYWNPSRKSSERAREWNDNWDKKYMTVGLS